MSGNAANSAKGWVGRPRIGHLGLVELLALALIGAFLAVIGAFDSDRIAFGRRLLYWVFVLVAGGICGGVIEPWLERSSALARRPILRGAALVLLMAAPAMVIVWATSGILFGGPWGIGRWPILYPQVALVCAALVMLAWLSRRRITVRTPTAPSDQAPPEALREKLPPRLARARLIAVQAEDHYLRVHTDAGDALLLMKFSDALELLADRDGLRTHRSWWVARRAVEEARWRRGRGDLALTGGLTAPVSRAYAAQVRATDWA